MKKNENSLPSAYENAVNAKVVGAVIEQLMRPMLENMGKFMTKMSEAVEHIATSQDVMRNRLEALEKQVRLDTPVTDRQARYLSDAAREKAADVLTKKGACDRKAVTKLAGVIKKTIMQRYGVGSLREIPKCEYNVAMSQIESWMNARAALEIAEEARARQEAEHAE